MIPPFEAPTVTNSFQAWFKTVPLNTQFPSLFFYYRFIIWIVTVSSRHPEFIKQIKDKICLNETSKQGFQVFVFLW